MAILKLPKPTIGIVSAITMASPDPDRSLIYYQQLGFREIFRSDFPFPLIQITDDALLIMLRKDDNPYIALTYYAKDPDNIANGLERAGISFIEKPKKGALVKKYLFQSPDGLNISVVTYADCFQKPAGHTLLTMPSADYFKPEKYTNKVCGMFGEFAHPVKDLKTSVSFWKNLGFIILSESGDPYPWAIVSDGLSIIGLHQSAHLSCPAITFYAADMGDKIQKLKQGGLKNYTALTGENVVLKTPEEQYINLFQLGNKNKSKK
jgi:catechol 2,3-dioxygenase-like lactoylglutathione lyase family enzyme